jgi:hypothetical protein
MPSTILPTPGLRASGSRFGLVRFTPTVTNRSPQLEAVLGDMIQHRYGMFPYGLGLHDKLIPDFRVSPVRTNVESVLTVSMIFSSFSGRT